MGQYFHPTFLANEKQGNKEVIIAAFNSHKYDNGLKLTEHSYNDNNFVNAVINTAKKYKKGVRIVWAGDYAKDEQYRRKNLYFLADEKVFINNASQKYPDVRWMFNENKGQVVDLWDLFEADGMTIHPLPILTAEGNGQGGGDYEGTSMNLVGSWARDVIRFAKNDWRKVSFSSDRKHLFVNDKTALHGTKVYVIIKPDFAASWNLINDFHHGIECIKLAIDQQMVTPSEVRKNLESQGFNRGIIDSILYVKKENKEEVQEVATTNA